MEEPDVYLKLKDEDESWSRSLHLSEDDALRTFNLLSTSRPSGEIALPSIGGRAEINGGKLHLTYRERSKENRLSVSVNVARDVFEDAIETAAEVRRDLIEHERVWNWVNERFEARVLTVQEGERVEAILLFSSGSYFAVQMADASVWVVDASDVHGDPLVGKHVAIKGGPEGTTVSAEVL